MVKSVGKYRHHMPTVFHSRCRLKIGLVGGSFNPAHDGHIHVALKARQQLGLDQIWWLVSPQNPLKSSLGMAPHEKRLADARKIATPYPFLRVIEPESRLPSNYTYNTLKYMIKTMRLSRLVWVMGADNLIYFHKWYKWKNILKKSKLIVFDRNGYKKKSLNSKTYNSTIGKQITFVEFNKVNISSSQLRKIW